MIERVLGAAYTNKAPQLLRLLIDNQDVLPQPEREVAEFAMKFYDKFGIVPGKNELALYSDEYSDYFQECNLSVDIIESWFKDRIRELKVADCIREAGMSLQRGCNMSEVSDILMRAARESMQEPSTIIDIKRDWEAVFSLAKSRKSDEYIISTGIKTLDKRIRGHSKDEVVVVAAASNAGKSMYLVQSVYSYLISGLKTLVFTLEINSERWAQRLIQRIGKTPDLEVLDRKKEDIARYLRLVDGEAEIRYYPPQTMTVADIEAIIERKKLTGFVPDVIVIDYMDEMKTPQIKGDYWEGQRQVVRGLGSLARRHECLVITATQTTKDAQKKEILTHKDIGGSYGRIQVADTVLAICRTQEDIEAGVGRIFVAKCRNEGGANSSVPLKINMGAALFEPLEVEDGAKAEEIAEAEGVGVVSVDWDAIEQDEDKDKDKDKEE